MEQMAHIQLTPGRPIVKRGEFVPLPVREGKGRVCQSVPPVPDCLPSLLLLARACQPLTSAGEVHIRRGIYPAATRQTLHYDGH